MRGPLTRTFHFLCFGVFALILAGGCSQLTPTEPTPPPTNPPPPDTSFKVSAAVAGVDNANFSGSCPKLFTFTGTITTVNGGGNVTYKWERSDGSASPTSTLVFAAAGSQTVSDTWALGVTGSGWQKLHVLTPNDISSNQAAFALTCAATGPVTSVTAAVDSSSYSGACPHTFNFTGTITANAPATVSYRWERSDGSATASQSLTFAAAGTQTVSSTWSATTSGSGWQVLHVLTPNDQSSGQAAFSLTCSGS